MPKVLQINVTANWGSHGKIAEHIGRLAMDKGWESIIAYGRGTPTSSSTLYHIGNSVNVYAHAFRSLIFGGHGLYSKSATNELVRFIAKENPDIIHLHNISGYYINYPVLFEFLRQFDKPVVWTLHDCWCFTGHCTHFEYDGCFKWKTHCDNCKFKHFYPESYIYENSYKNFELKKRYFTAIKNLTLVPVSNWLERYLFDSFMKGHNIRVIHNGVNLDIFKPKIIKNFQSYQKILLGIASDWKTRKGFPDFLELRKRLDASFMIIMIGLSKKEIKTLPHGIIGLERTDSVEELVSYYNKATMVVNPTYEDNFPTVNLESLACGTPVVTYDTGGSKEAIDERAGIVVEQGNIDKLEEAIHEVCSKGKDSYSKYCRDRAERLYNHNNCFMEYISLYESLLNLPNKEN